MISYFENNHLDVAAFQQSKDEKQYCGDGYVVITEDDFALCAVVDGLGSGKGAFESAEAVLEEVKKNIRMSLDLILESCNKQLLGKRGAVVTLLKIDFIKKEFHYSNMGNVGFALYYPNGEVIQPIPQRGYLSGHKKPFSMKSFPYEKNSTFMMYTDGIKSPPNKKQLLELDSLKRGASALFKAVKDVHDDMTLLIGKLH
ncbi:PP2C family serine/threonine-protein phosphatase [Alkalihalobacillus trypoxylicola]|uniref:Indirect negative regulator of sigma-B activity n=1 Tax=Alkalihalobacillus trypoxylicola TaxID=519424 RepID=A0A162F3F8_9BACI|nr:PP2C family serine/threonine-protein phosphatase [Alkalihalobacillus trypoxylicola]KYG34406.1 indirect negative regulator of sigma-B activity [Alkalihalobacillus trypoxylicola]GAF64711.1 hypothetical protein BTS2_1607 [Bacillus sp. TS-2]